MWTASRTLNSGEDILKNWTNENSAFAIPTNQGRVFWRLEQWNFSFRNSHQSREGILKTWTNEKSVFTIPTNQGGNSEDLKQWKFSFRNSHQSGGEFWRLEPMKIQPSQFPPIMGGYSEDLNQWKFSFRNSHQSGDGIHQTVCQPGGQWQLFGLPRGKSFGKQINYKDNNVTNEVISLWGS